MCMSTCGYTSVCECVVGVCRGGSVVCVGSGVWYDVDGMDGVSGR